MEKAWLNEMSFQHIGSDGVKYLYSIHYIHNTVDI